MHELPELPYSPDALAPQISAETLEFHHGKHHKSYVDKLNGLIDGTPHASMSLEELVCEADGGIFNNAAQHYNHSLYWVSLAPASGQKPEGALAEALQRDFGSFDKFQEQFTAAALGQFGSGWAWLSVDGGGKLQLAATSNAKTPLRDGHTPIMTCDVWEHAYYIDYRNARPKYLESFWQLVDWKSVGERFESAAQATASA